MDNPLQQLLDMADVHRFYLVLLKSKLGYDIPVPHDVPSSENGEDKIQQSLTLMTHWLALLDLAITAPMVRDGLKQGTIRKESAEAMLRYFYRKCSCDDSDRDKADFIVTYLFRESQIPLRSVEDWSPEEPSQFEELLYASLSVDQVLPLPEEHRQLVREFPFIRQEVEDIRHFDKLMDSGITQRVRDIKQRFGVSFYHPSVLATIAEYNVFMGDRFDVLFRQAAHSIKQFAATVQQAGGSIMARVEGDVTVKQLADVAEDEILEKEYGRAQEQLREVSRFKKAVDSRRGSSIPAPTASSAAASVGRSSFKPAPPAIASSKSPFVNSGVPADLTRSLDQELEDSKVRAVQESIHNFVVAADPKAADVFPSRYGNVMLSPAEMEAFKAEYRGEKSFRGEYANTISLCVALVVRMLTEIEEFGQRKHSAYLWKPHADSLAFLLGRANRLQEEGAHLAHLAATRGLTDKVNALRATLLKLRSQTLAAAKTLEGTAK
jgi:hypothetical protein